MDAKADHGRWPPVVVNTALLVVSAAGIFRPRAGLDWRAMGAFLVAVFAARTPGFKLRPWRASPAARGGRPGDRAHAAPPGGLW